MKKTLLYALVIILFAFVITSIAAAGTASYNKDDKSGNQSGEADKSDKTDQQEFYWDDSQGTFRKVDLFTTGEVDEKLKYLEKQLSSVKNPDETLTGSPSSYTYWDGNKWVTLENIPRFEGGDQRAEGLVTRYDLSEYTFSPSNWESVAGYQSIYSSYASYQNNDNPDGNNPPDKNSKPKTLFSSKELDPDSFDPVVEVQLANGWTVTINSRYDRSGTELKVTSPDGNTSFIYGDSGTAGSGSSPSIIDLDKFIFDLDGYTLRLETEEDGKGGYRIENIILSGPNGYQLTFNRNNEVRVYGGTK